MSTKKQALHKAPVQIPGAVPTQATVQLQGTALTQETIQDKRVDPGSGSRQHIVKRPRLTLIVAYAGHHRVIGRDNRLPWKLPGDLAYFKRITLGHSVVMGRKTWESLSRPLPGRQNIVISRNQDYTAPGAIVVPDIATAIQVEVPTDEIFIIGGAQIYAAALGCADRILATEIEAEVEGDTFFPPLPIGQWRECTRQPQPIEAGYRYDFVVYEKFCT